MTTEEAKRLLEEINALTKEMVAGWERVEEEAKKLRGEDQ